MFRIVWCFVVVVELHNYDRMFLSGGATSLVRTTNLSTSIFGNLLSTWLLVM